MDRWGMARLDCKGKPGTVAGLINIDSARTRCDKYGISKNYPFGRMEGGMMIKMGSGLYSSRQTNDVMKSSFHHIKSGDQRRTARIGYPRMGGVANGKRSKNVLAQTAEINCITVRWSLLRTVHCNDQYFHSKSYFDLLWRSRPEAAIMPIGGVEEAEFGIGQIKMMELRFKFLTTGREGELENKEN